LLVSQVVEESRMIGRANRFRALGEICSAGFQACCVWWARNAEDLAGALSALDPAPARVEADRTRRAASRSAH
jgi:hypothetical protein